MEKAQDQAKETDTIEKPNTKESKSNHEEEEDPLSAVEKIIAFNKLGGIFLAGDDYNKALSIFMKTLKILEDYKEQKKIGEIHYNNLYCNIAKTLSCLKRFEEAGKYYQLVLKHHPLNRILLEHKDLLKEDFLIDFENLLTDRDLDESVIRQKFDIIVRTYSQGNDRLKFTPADKFIKSPFSSLGAYSDSLVNLAVIMQYTHKRENMTAFDMYYLALLLDPLNRVANIDFNNVLRQNGLRELSDEFIKIRIRHDYLESLAKTTLNPMRAIPAIRQINANTQKKQGKDLTDLVFTFVCMKWGDKYGADYVNKLYNGVKRNFTKEFEFYCITEKPDELDESIKTLPLDCSFKGWMKKAYLFSPSLSRYFGKRICFIDLDMVVYSSIDFLGDYDGDFCVLKTDDIQCEGTKDGYNSSVVLWRNGFCGEIYSFIEAFHEHITGQVVRFDHFLEFIVKGGDFIQDIFQGKVLDYNTYCKDRDLPESGAIVAFPRHPKPHQCKDAWLEKYWI